MLTPRQPVSARRADRFRPPHCPWPECPAHGARGDYRCIRKGWYERGRGPRRRVRRFRCGTCGRTFGQDAFSTTYRLKRPELLAPIANLLVSGSCHRHIARHLGCAPSTVTRLSVRIGDHCEQFHKMTMAEIAAIREAIVLDHFETFVRSKPERLSIATPVGEKSWFVYGLEPAAHLRLEGRSKRRKALRSTPSPVPPRGHVRSTTAALEPLLDKAGGTLALISDDHIAYPPAVRELTAPGNGGRILHAVFPNPDRSDPSPAARAAARARDDAMFAVDLLHKIVRHCQAHHRRATIAFGRRRRNVMARTWLLAVWRNMIKKITERKPCRRTPAMTLGLASAPWTWDDILAERRFPLRTAAQAA